MRFIKPLLIAACLFCVCVPAERARRRAGASDYAIKVFPNVTHSITIFRPQGGAWDFPRAASAYLDATADWSAARVGERPAGNRPGRRH